MTRAPRKSVADESLESGVLSLALESKSIWRTAAWCLLGSGTPPRVIPGELAIPPEADQPQAEACETRNLAAEKGTGNFFDSAEKPSVHPSRASGRTEEHVKSLEIFRSC